MEALETTRSEVGGRARTLCGAGGKSAVVEWVMHVHLNYSEWTTPSRGRAIRRCRKQGVPPIMGRLNLRASLARRASGGGIYAGSEELNFNDKIA